jgi:hypothetical protein
MKKEEVELIIIKVSASGQDAINMKIYKNGTTCRYGVGGLPQLNISGMSFVNDSRYFDPLMARVPQDILDTPINHEEETPNGYLEYMVAFYGASKNGDNGERADWSKSTGVRIKMDQQLGFNHPIMSFLDDLTMDAAELTNPWYFDVILNAKWKVRSSDLPTETIISQPKTEEEIHQDYDNYVNQMTYSARKWSLSDYVKGKTYKKDGILYHALITDSNDVFTIDFIPASKGKDALPVNESPEPTKKKPWWKF